MYKRILVPLDGSKLAEAALKHAEQLALLFESELVLLRVVVSPYAIVPPDMVMAGTDPNMQQLNNHAENYLKALAGELSEKGIKTRCIVTEGPVAEVVIDHASTLDVSMIIMSTHGRGGVSRWVYGSAAERILQGAQCPVLLIRAGKSG